MSLCPRCGGEHGADAHERKRVPTVPAHPDTDGLRAAVEAAAEVHRRGHGMWTVSEWTEFTQIVDALDWQALAATEPTTSRSGPLIEVALMAFDPTHPKYRDNLATKVAGTVALRRMAALVPAHPDTDGLRAVLRYYDERVPPDRLPELSAAEWRDAYFALARVALKQLEPLWAATEAAPLAVERWCIWFEDPDHGHETFVGADAEGAARRRFEQASQSWTCTLFRAVSPPIDRHTAAHRDAK